MELVTSRANWISAKISFFVIRLIFAAYPIDPPLSSCIVADQSAHFSYMHANTLSWQKAKNRERGELEMQRGEVTGCRAEGSKTERQKDCLSLKWASPCFLPPRLVDRLDWKERKENKAPFGTVGAMQSATPKEKECCRTNQLTWLVLRVNFYRGTRIWEIRLIVNWKSCRNLRS